MGLIRLIILGVVVWLCLRMVRKFQAGQQKSNRKLKPLEQSSMVPCKVCGVHLPESRAIRHNEFWFCSEEHKRKFYDADNR